MVAQTTSTIKFSATRRNSLDYLCESDDFHFLSSDMPKVSQAIHMVGESLVEESVVSRASQLSYNPYEGNKIVSVNTDIFPCLSTYKIINTGKRGCDEVERQISNTPRRVSSDSLTFPSENELLNVKNKKRKAMKEPCSRKSSKAKIKKSENEAVGKPRRPLSAYNFFFQHQRAELVGTNVPDIINTKNDNQKVKRRPHRKTHGKIGFVDLSKLVGQRWKKSDKESRAYYYKLAVEDKERYQKELVEYNRVNSQKNKHNELRPTDNLMRPAVVSPIREVFNDVSFMIEDDRSCAVKKNYEMNVQPLTALSSSNFTLPNIIPDDSKDGNICALLGDSAMVDILKVLVSDDGIESVPKMSLS